MKHRDLNRRPLTSLLAIAASLLAFTAQLPAHADDSGVQTHPDDLKTFKLIAHRGASGHAPEHTWAAYDKAREMGADYLELDLHMSADGEIIVIHDDSLDRTTNGEGRVQEHNLEQLKALDAGSWFNEKYPDRADETYVGAKLLTLDEVIGRYGKEVRYYIETKSPQRYPELQRELVETLDEAGLIESGSVVIQSFSQASLQEIRGLNADIPLVQLLWYSPREEGGLKEWNDTTPAPEDMTDADFKKIASYAIGVGPNVIYRGNEVIDQRFIEQAHNNGLIVHSYTINEPEQMQRLIGWGVDGMFTDFPDRLRAMVD
ncbi:glycerophosphodiester phosphodiesterase [Marinobacterium lutimaris]|uniref:Glycerophosphoryl diester phosphodiesterase n=1 Tax=Marinobacterium lutimaris TaxID=568106 RepID=A0A1H5TZ47_9GAMM|nr:glycerophosphodiester phosphodiesterase [Marinobacterium lutimaris]SEF67458.1 glycerophosphoryl diester phosphodiesterase [Marinobacterium lutimaris]